MTTHEPLKAIIESCRIPRRADGTVIIDRIVKADHGRNARWHVEKVAADPRATDERVLECSSHYVKLDAMIQYSGRTEPSPGGHYHLRVITPASAHRSRDATVLGRTIGTQRSARRWLAHKIEMDALSSGSGKVVGFSESADAEGRIVLRMDWQESCYPFGIFTYTATSCTLDECAVDTSWTELASASAEGWG